MLRPNLLLGPEGGGGRELIAMGERSADYLPTEGLMPEAPTWWPEATTTTDYPCFCLS